MRNQNHNFEDVFLFSRPRKAVRKQIKAIIKTIDLQEKNLVECASREKPPYHLQQELCRYCPNSEKQRV